MAETSFDTVIVGGPGGWRNGHPRGAAWHETAVVERSIWGICLNWGCIPTKACWWTAEIYRNIQHAEEFLYVNGLSFDINKIINARGLPNNFGEVGYLLEEEQCYCIDGHGKLTAGDGGLKKTGVVTELAATNIILPRGLGLRTAGPGARWKT